MATLPPELAATPFGNMISGLSGFQPTAATQPLVSAYGQYAGDLSSQGFFVNPLNPTIASSAYGSSGLLGAAGVEQFRAAEAARQGIPYTPLMGAGAQTGFTQAQAAGLTPQQMVTVGQEFTGAGRVNITPDQGVRVTDLEGDVIFSGTGPEALRQASELTSGFGLNKGWILQSSNAAGDEWTTRYVKQPLGTGLSSVLTGMAPLVLSGLGGALLGPAIASGALGSAAGSAIGSGLGTAVSGGSITDILKAAAMSGASSFALNSLAQQLGISPSTTTTDGAATGGSSGSSSFADNVINVTAPSSGFVPSSTPGFTPPNLGGYANGEITVTGQPKPLPTAQTLAALGLTLGGAGLLAGGGAGAGGATSTATAPSTSTPTPPPAAGNEIVVTGTPNQLAIEQLVAAGVPLATATMLVGAAAPVQPVQPAPGEISPNVPSLGGGLLSQLFPYLRAALIANGLLGGGGGGGGGGVGLPQYSGTIGQMPNLGRGTFQPYTGDYETYGTRAEHQFFKPLLS